MSFYYMSHRSTLSKNRAYFSHLSSLLVHCLALKSFWAAKKINVNVSICRTALGVYGNVHRVKILFNKKDNALVQMADPSQAQQGRSSLRSLENLN